MPPPRRWPDLYPPRRWTDEDVADIDDATDAAHEAEWSTDQTFVGEFGDLDAFGDPRD